MILGHGAGVLVMMAMVVTSDMCNDQLLCP
jgi:hypothetical protein